MNPASNEELVQLQQIEKGFNSNPILQGICKKIGQKFSNPRLSQFLSEFFSLTFQQQPDTVERAIKILNDILVTKLKKSIDTVMDQQLLMYAKNEYEDVLAAFYEKAFLSTIDEAQKQQSYVYNRRILIHANEDSPSERVNEILKKIEQAYNVGKTQLDFEEQLFNNLTSDEMQLFANLASDYQNRPAPKKQQSQYEKFKTLMPPNIAQKYSQFNNDDPQKFAYFLEQEGKGEFRDWSKKFWSFHFYSKLSNLLQQSYLTIQSQKVKKSDIEKLIQDLFIDVTTISPKQKEKFEYQQISTIKYFYKSLKFRKLNGDKRASLDNPISMRMKLQEFTKFELKPRDWPRKAKQLIFSKSWKQTYQELYQELPKFGPEDAEKIFGMIKSFQALILQFLRFRWQYLYLFYCLIVETQLSNQELDIVIDKAFEMLQKTTRDQLNQSFDNILNKLNEQTNQKLKFIFPEDQYTWVSSLEIQLTTVNNKIMQLYIKMQKYQQYSSLYSDIHKFELNIIQECNDNLKYKQEVFNRVLDATLSGEKEEKDSKQEFFQTYFVSYYQKLNQLQSDKSNSSQIKKRQYFLNLVQLRQEFLNKTTPFQEQLTKEEKINFYICRVLMKESQQYMNYSSQEQREALPNLLTLFMEIFLNQNPYIFFLSSFLKCLIYFQDKKSVKIICERIEKIRYLVVGFSEGQIESFINSNYKHAINDDVLDLNQFPLERLYYLAQNIYNYYAEYMHGGKQWKDQFFKSNDLQQLNSNSFNIQAILAYRITGTDQKSIRSVQQFNLEFPKLSDLIFNKLQYDQIERIEQNKNDLNLLMFNEIKSYKTALLKEAVGYPQLAEKLVEVFQRLGTRQKLLIEIPIFKLENKIPLNDLELINFSKKKWSEIFQEALKTEQDMQKKLSTYFQQVFNNPSFTQIYNQFQKDSESEQCDKGIRLILQKNIKAFNNEISKYQHRDPIVQARQKVNILNIESVRRKLCALRADPKYKDFQAEDQGTLQFIQEQFEQFMKNLIGKVLQTALTQERGNEFKVYQNKTVTDQQRYKQHLELQKQYGPQKDSTLDLVLLSNNESKIQNIYELCDYTQIQRQNEFRKYMVEIEPLQDDILRNKIRQNKWREEHPHLNDILSKKIKRGTELWSYVQDFLCNRGKKYQDDDEYDDAINQQQNNNQESIVDIKSLKNDLQVRLREAEKTYSSNRLQTTRLINMDNNNHLQTTKDISVKTVQFVLETMPFYRKSKILYKSYI